MVFAPILLASLAPIVALAIPQNITARTAPAPILDTVDTWQSLGCFVDTSAGTLSFELEDNPNMIVSDCVNICNNEGFILAGLTGATQCFCGNIIKSGGTAATADACAVGCGGDVTQSCGGVRGQRILIYEKTPFVEPAVVQSVGEWASLGCWSDDPQSRALHHDGGGSDGQTVEDCLNTCNAAGFPLAGVEFGLQCFCGNAVLYDHLQTDDASCNIACAGNPTEMCGGLGAMNLYQFADTPFTSGAAVIPQSFGDWTLSGCTQEASSGRAVPTSMEIPIEDMTVEVCLNACAAANFTVGALQFGEECRCGNVALSSLTAIDASKCDDVCNGNANEFCGGPGANQVYFTPDATQ